MAKSKIEAKVSKNIRPFIKRDYIKREMINGVPTNQNSGFWSKVFKNQILKWVEVLFHTVMMNRLLIRMHLNYYQEIILIGRK
jgi:hypothetical protein